MRIISLFSCVAKSSCKIKQAMLGGTPPLPFVERWVPVIRFRAILAKTTNTYRKPVTSRGSADSVSDVRARLKFAEFCIHQGVSSHAYLGVVSLRRFVDDQGSEGCFLMRMAPCHKHHAPSLECVGFALFRVPPIIKRFYKHCSCRWQQVQRSTVDDAECPSTPRCRHILRSAGGLCDVV